jgi:hypothetical protein
MKIIFRFAAMVSMFFFQLTFHYSLNEQAVGGKTEAKDPFAVMQQATGGTICQQTEAGSGNDDKDSCEKSLFKIGTADCFRAVGTQINVRKVLGIGVSCIPLRTQE